MDCTGLDDIVREKWYVRIKDSNDIWFESPAYYTGEKQAMMVCLEMVQLCYGPVKSAYITKLSQDGNTRYFRRLRLDPPRLGELYNGWAQLEAWPKKAAQQEVWVRWYWSLEFWLLVACVTAAVSLALLGHFGYFK